MRAGLQTAVGLLLLGASSAEEILKESPIEVIDLDLPPEKRWVEFAQRHNQSIIYRAASVGQVYEENLGEEIAERWFKAAPVGEEFMAEYKSIVEAVNDKDVTLRRLILADMWHAVHAPSFECTGLLATMSNGTVVHGRNIDYDFLKMQEHTPPHPRRGTNGDFYTGILMKNGLPLGTYVATLGSLGFHTGMRYGGWSYNSNARLVENDMMENLLATEAGSQNFPWTMRHLLQDVPDYSTAFKAVKEMNVNAPNYFILSGVGPYEGAIVTKDRGGKQEPGTPDVQELSREKGIWYLVQTNDDAGEPPLDRRRDAALLRLKSRSSDQVNMDFVLKEMQAEPTTNSDTLLTWVASPGLGVHHTYPHTAAQMQRQAASRVWHKAMHKPMAHEFPTESPLLSRKSQPTRLRQGRATVDTD